MRPEEIGTAGVAANRSEMLAMPRIAVAAFSLLFIRFSYGNRPGCQQCEASLSSLL